AALLGLEADLEVATFTQLSELRAAVAGRAPDAVIAEVTLAGSDGIDLLQELAAEDPDLAWLVVTSQSDPDATALALSRVGPLHLCHKPFDPRDLLPKLRAVLERRALSRELGVARAALEQQNQAL